MVNIDSVDFKKLKLSDAELIDAKNDLEITTQTLAFYQDYTIELLKLVGGLQKQIDEIHDSMRWKITQPLCKAMDILSSRQSATSITKQNQTDSAVFKTSPFGDVKKKNILIFDRQIPQPDKDAGSRSIFQYMQLLCEMGYSVKLIADNCDADPIYLERLQKTGIELIRTEIDSDWKSFVSLNAQKIGFVVLNRPNVALKYIDYLKANLEAKIIYFGCDLHFLREMREYECTKDAESLESANRIKLKEFIAISKADVTMMYSDYEKKVIKEEFGKTNVLTAPIYYFENFDFFRKEYKETKDIIFVGGFSHKPNIDGLLWFVNEIWPNVKEKLSDAKLIVIGSNPTEEILAAANEGVLVKGFVSDEELQRLYSECRLCIIPLRYGAGIKGKTIEAIKNGIPVVSTSVGLEGIDGIEQYIKSADTIEEFARQVVETYSNEYISKETAEKYKSYVKQNFNKENLKEKLNEIFRY